MNELKRLRESYRIEMKSNMSDLQDQRTRENFAILFAKENEVVSASSLQRAFLIGYETANGLIDFLIDYEYITKPKSNKINSKVVEG